MLGWYGGLDRHGSPWALSACVFARQDDAWIEQASGVVPIGTLLRW